MKSSDLEFTDTWLSVTAGLMVMPRTPIASSMYDEDEAVDLGSVDASLLPPG